MFINSHLGGIYAPKLKRLGTSQFWQCILVNILETTQKIYPHLRKIPKSYNSKICFFPSLIGRPSLRFSIYCWRLSFTALQDRQLLKNAGNSVNVLIEQRVAIKFLVNECIKIAEIYRRFQALYAENCIPVWTHEGVICKKTFQHRWQSECFTIVSWQQ